MLFNPCEPCCGCYHANIPQYKCTSNYSSSLYSGKLGGDIDWMIICSSGHILDRFSCSGVRRFDMDYVLSSGNDYFTNPQYALPTWLGQPINNMSINIKFPCLDEDVPFVNNSPLMSTMLSTPTSPNSCANIELNPIMSGYYQRPGVGSGYRTSQEKQFLQFTIELGENSNNYYLIDSIYHNFPIKPPLPKNSPLTDVSFSATGIITNSGIVGRFKFPDLILTNVSGVVNGIREFTYKLLPFNYYTQPIQTGIYTQNFKESDSSLLNKCNYIEDSSITYANNLSLADVDFFRVKGLEEPYTTKFNDLKNLLEDNLYAKMIIRTNESGVQIHSSGCKSYGVGTEKPSELWVTTIFSGVPVTLYYQCNALGRSQAVYAFNKPFDPDEPVDSNPRATSLSAPLSFYKDNTGNIVAYKSADQDGIYSLKKNPDISTQDGYDYNDVSPSWVFASGWLGTIDNPGLNFKEFCGIKFKNSRVFVNSGYDYPENYYESEQISNPFINSTIINPFTGAVVDNTSLYIGTIFNSGAYIYNIQNSGSYVDIATYIIIVEGFNVRRIPLFFEQKDLPFDDGCLLNNHYINTLFGLNLPIYTNLWYRNQNKIINDHPGSAYYGGWNYDSYFSDDIKLDNPTLEKFYVRIEYNPISVDYGKNKFLEANVISFPCARGDSVQVTNFSAPLIFQQNGVSLSGIDYRGETYNCYNTGLNFGFDFRYYTKDHFMYEHKDGNILSNTLQSTTISKEVNKNRLITEYQKYVIKNVFCDVFDLESDSISKFNIGIIRWNDSLKYWEILDQQSVTWERSGIDYLFGYNPYLANIVGNELTTVTNQNNIDLDISNAYLRPGEFITDYGVALISDNMPVFLLGTTDLMLRILDNYNHRLMFAPLSFHAIVYR